MFNSKRVFMEKRLSMFLASLFFMVGAAVDQVQVKGTIISADDGEPLPGASIKVLGTKTGTTTDMNGDFVITVPANDSRLEISHIGMLPRVVKARNGMRIALDTDEHLLDDVMVVAYGTTKRSTFTGSAVEVKSEDITSHVSSTATNALIGKVAGVQATGVSAGPGSAPTIRIRGFGSMEASTTPLYVLDGVPMEERTARFRTAIVLIMDGEIHTFEGKVEGHILTERHGTGGFGYDPIFHCEEADVDFGTADEKTKNTYSHRAKAIQKLKVFLAI